MIIGPRLGEVRIAKLDPSCLGPPPARPWCNFELGEALDDLGSLDCLGDVVDETRAAWRKSRSRRRYRCGNRNKGCWNAELFTAIETQLCNDYPRRLGAPLGIYWVGWFYKAKWDENDSRKKRDPSMNIVRCVAA